MTGPVESKTLFGPPLRRRGWQDETVGWRHWLNGHEFEQTLGDGGGLGSLGCCSPQCYKSRTWLSNWTTTTDPLLGPEPQTRYQLRKRLQWKELFEMGNTSIHSLLRPGLLRCGATDTWGPNESLLRETVLFICTMLHNTPGLSMPIPPLPLPQLWKQKCLQASANASWFKLERWQW